MRAKPPRGGCGPASGARSVSANGDRSPAFARTPNGQTRPDGTASAFAGRRSAVEQVACSGALRRASRRRAPADAPPRVDACAAHSRRGSCRDVASGPVHGRARSAVSVRGSSGVNRRQARAKTQTFCVLEASRRDAGEPTAQVVSSSVTSSDGTPSGVAVAQRSRHTPPASRDRGSARRRRTSPDRAVTCREWTPCRRSRSAPRSAADTLAVEQPGSAEAVVLRDVASALPVGNRDARRWRSAARRRPKLRSECGSDDGSPGCSASPDVLMRRPRRGDPTCLRQSYGEPGSGRPVTMLARMTISGRAMRATSSCSSRRSSRSTRFLIKDLRYAFAGDTMPDGRPAYRRSRPTLREGTATRRLRASLAPGPA